MTIPLPILADVRELAPRRPIDRSRPYASCEWLEGGLAFNRRGLHACLIVHHGRGFPHLCDFNGGEVPVERVLAARDEIIRRNQAHGHPACAGCAHLVTRRWKPPRHAFHTLGIAQFARCNIACNYCFLQTQDPASFAAGFDPYAVRPAIEQLVRDGLLAPDALIDWGGGEPTIYPEFDAILALTARRGATHWVHTNGTRLPAPLRDGLSGRRINVLCSIDAGTRETYRRMKGHDFLDLVWRNLAEYRRLGCHVAVKYIVTADNCTAADLVPFVRRMASTGLKRLLIDIDYNHPDPTPAVLDGLRRLRRLADRHGLYAATGFTGANFTPEAGVGEKVGAGLYPTWASRLGRATDWVRNTASDARGGIARRLAKLIGGRRSCWAEPPPRKPARRNPRPPVRALS